MSVNFIPQRRNDPTYVYLMALVLKALQEGLNITPVADDYAMGGEDVVEADCSGGDITVTLPLVKEANRREVIVKKTDGGAYTLKVAGDASIDDAEFVSSNTAYAKFRLISDGEKWIQV